MTNKNGTRDGYRPANEGYQPRPEPKPQTGRDIRGGYQPTTSQAKPVKPPPKKP